MSKKVIDLAKHQGPVFSGRERGVQVRELERLDEADQKQETLDVRIPPGTYSVTSSFFLGMFGPSIVRAGSTDAFFRKFPSLQRILFGNRSRATQRALSNESRSSPDGSFPLGYNVSSVVALLAYPGGLHPSSDLCSIFYADGCCNPERSSGEEVRGSRHGHAFEDRGG